MKMTEENTASRTAWKQAVQEVSEEVYRRRKEKEKQEYQSGMYKVYLVEAHWDNARIEHRELERRLSEVLTKNLGGANKFLLDAVEDRFFRLRRDDYFFVIECATPRFWRVETIIPTVAADRGARMLMKRGAMLDQLWLPTSYQRAIPHEAGGSVRALSAGFKLAGLRRTARDEENGTESEDAAVLMDEADELRGAEFIVRLGGDSAQADFNDILEHTRLASRMAVYRTESRAEKFGGVALASAWYHGKMSLRGSSLRALQLFPTAAVNLYRRGIGAVESRQIDVSSSRIQGGRILINLRRTDLSSAEFERLLFEQAEVFKLVLAWKDELPGGPRFEVVDTHTGDPLTLDYIHKRDGTTQLSVQLDKRSCGNAVPRLLANIQQFIDAAADCPVLDSAIEGGPDRD